MPPTTIVLMKEAYLPIEQANKQLRNVHCRGARVRFTDFDFRSVDSHSLRSLIMLMA